MTRYIGVLGTYSVPRYNPQVPVGLKMHKNIPKTESSHRRSLSGISLRPVCLAGLLWLSGYPRSVYQTTRPAIAEYKYCFFFCF